MAKSTISVALTLMIVVLGAYLQQAAAAGRLVGGRTQVKNVKDNKEIQELGRYCVAEYNRRHKANADKLLIFLEVVEAQTQVVSGFKYYLKISAATQSRHGQPTTFDAVVVVKPWLRSKDLIQFTPSPPPTTTTATNYKIF